MPWKRRWAESRAALALIVLAGAGCHGTSWVPAPAPPEAPEAVDHDATPADGPRAGRRGDPASPRFDEEVGIHLEKIDPGAKTIAFGVPIATGVLADASTVSVTAGARPLEVTVHPLVRQSDASVRAVLVQMPAELLHGPSLDVDVHFHAAPAKHLSSAMRPFASAGSSFESPETIETAHRAIVPRGGGGGIVERRRDVRVLFRGREPSVLATYPEGYLAQTGVYGELLAASDARSEPAGTFATFSRALLDFSRSAMYEMPYAVEEAAVSDPAKDVEGWLYDRCATYLIAYAHGGEPRTLRHALRACSFYAAHIRKDGPNAGTFDLKPDPDPKYSHVRGLYGYYALTGDEGALAAATAIARMWERDPYFVVPYREGHVRGPDKLWTERLLAASLEGLSYGHLLTGDPKLREAARELFETAYRHVTGDAKALAAINPGHSFPPQNCFIHSAEQHAEGEANEPWCSGWMVELLVDPLLRYRDITGDERVLEVLVRLGRFLRDVGSAYLTDDVRQDSFLHPSVCPDDSAENPRLLIPLYGAGIDSHGKRANFGEASDAEHCADATGVAAAAIWALGKQGRFQKGGPIGPFATEGQSMLALHAELAFCATKTFAEHTRTHRDPGAWTSEELGQGVGDPERFVVDNRIGWPVYDISPARKLGWWFNGSMLQFALLRGSGVPSFVHAPRLSPKGCR